MTERQEALRIVENAMGPLGEIDRFYQQALQTERKYDAKAERKYGFWMRLGKLAKIAAGIGAFLVMCEVGDTPLALVGAISTSRKPVYIFMAVYFLLMLIVSIKLVPAAVELAFQKIGRQNGGISAKKQAALAPVSQKIEEIYRANQKAIDCLPRDYRHYHAAQYLEEALANGRAENMKEALLQYEEFCHREAMEEYGRAALREGQMQSEMLSRMERRVASLESAVEWNFILP